MSRTRINDGLSEFDQRVVAAAEADLDRLLALEPSPDFAAKVLARISEGHPARGWRAGWAGVALAAAATLVIAFMLRSGSGARDGDVNAPKSVHADVVLSSPASDMQVRVSPVITPSTRPRPAGPRIGDPEVLIDRSLADAIHRLAVSTRNMTLDDGAPDDRPRPASESPTPSVVVEPLTVPELVLKPANQNGGR
jgi:hypothetical protein